MGKKINSFTDDALGRMDAVGIADAIAKNQISVEEAKKAAIHRAEKVNLEINAISVKAYNDKHQKVLQNKKGLLHGVPTFVKDNEDIAGYPTQMGTGAYKAKKAKQNGKFVNQFLSTGVINLGKSTLPELGLLCSTENELWGITRNPWNTDYTTGGSSSGSGALVASGVVPIATANDGAGSIRIPAACCGLVGLKPSRYRLMPLKGTELLPLQIVYEGVLTRTVRDTAAFYAAAEVFYANKKLPKVGHVKHASNRRLKIALIENQPEGKLGHTDQETYRVQLETAKLLESLGHKVEQIPLPVDIESAATDFLNYYGFISFMLIYMSRFTLNSKVDKEKLEPFTIGLAKRFKSNFLQFPSSIKNLVKMGQEATNILNEYDLIMSPVVAYKTPKIGHFSPLLSFDEITDRALKFASYAAMQNVTGLPSLSLPLGISNEDMPIGVQFTAPMGLENRLLELAYELEDAKPWRMIYE